MGVFEQHEEPTPEEKREIVLRLIAARKDRRLVLPAGRGIHANLADVDLHGFDLRGANLQGANLQGAILWRANLHGANLAEANLQGADLRGALLHGADLGGANLQRARLSEANLQGAILWDAHLERANMRGTNLQDARLDGANLENAYLANANLRHAVLVDTHLRRAILVDANLQRADLWRAHLEGAQLDNSNLQDAKLVDANLNDATLDHANLGGANLRGARIERVDLSTATVTNIRIAWAWLNHTRLEHTQLEGAIGEEIAGEHGEARQAYLTLKRNFDELGDYDAASWAYRKERRMEKLEALQEAGKAFAERRLWTGVKSCAKAASDWLVEILCDYGESGWRVLAWLAALLLFIGPGLIWAAGGLAWTETMAKAYWSIPTELGRQLYVIQRYLLYVPDMLTTADFTELEPATGGVRLVSGLLALSGIFLTGLLGFVAAKRISRS